MKLSRAELARKLKVSPAYVTMICGGQRVLSKRLQKKVNKLGLTNEFKNTTLNQQVTGSTPVRLTKIRTKKPLKQLKVGGFYHLTHFSYCRCLLNRVIQMF